MFKRKQTTQEKRQQQKHDTEKINYFVTQHD